MEHDPHIGEAYAKSPDRTAIMGYSHWAQEPDHAAFTTQTMRSVIDGKYQDISFFNFIPAYFREERTYFWNRVMFLNFLPRKIGGPGDRFATGSAEATLAGKERALRLMEVYAPNRLFVFSRKAWEGLPSSLEDAAKVTAQRILEDQIFDRHHYHFRTGHVVQAFGLRHTQGAIKEVMTRAITAALRMPPSTPNLDRP
ncbi:hypothetical protein [Sphingomonas sp.]|jgi:hypothetical protein|uniref:hypothetical protein n=1 Tax=Sphingomonas sp. TaxID=28214 RepID=UPI002ED7F4A3